MIENADEVSAKTPDDVSQFGLGKFCVLKISPRSRDLHLVKAEKSYNTDCCCRAQKDIAFCRTVKS